MWRQIAGLHLACGLSFIGGMFVWCVVMMSPLLFPGQYSIAVLSLLIGSPLCGVPSIFLRRSQMIVTTAFLIPAGGFLTLALYAWMRGLPWLKDGTQAVAFMSACAMIGGVLCYATADAIEQRRAT